MTPRRLHRGLGAVFVSLVLACGAGDNIESSREAVPGDDRTMAVTASTEALACLSQPCFDVTINGANITYIFVDACSASANDYSITGDGEPVAKLNTNGGPCQSIARDVWFQLTSN